MRSILGTAGARFIKKSTDSSQLLTFMAWSTILPLLMRPKSRTLTDHELEIMKIVWELESATVKVVHQCLLQKRGIAYTTVMTMMKILKRKNYLRRTLQGRAYTYYPTRPKEEVIHSMVLEFVERVFNGSAESLLDCLLQGDDFDRPKLLEMARRALEEDLR